MDQTVTMPWEILDRMELAVERVRERLLRATAALNAAAVTYAVTGANAVASWVARIDEGAVRSTPDVDLLARRDDLPAITEALRQAGFTPGDAGAFATFLDGPGAKRGDRVRLSFSGEKLRPDHPAPAPAVETVEDPAGFPVLRLESLLFMMLVSNRNEDGMHVRDLIGVGLIDGSWVPKLPPVLAERLQHILDTPDG